MFFSTPVLDRIPNSLKTSLNNSYLETQKTLGNSLTNAGRLASHTFQKLRDRASEYTSKPIKPFTQTFAEASARWQNKLEATTSFIKKHPLASIAISCFTAASLSSIFMYHISDLKLPDQTLKIDAPPIPTHNSALTNAATCLAPQYSASTGNTTLGENQLTSNPITTNFGRNSIQVPRSCNPTNLRDFANKLDRLTWVLGKQINEDIRPEIGPLLLNQSWADHPHFGGLQSFYDKASFQVANLAECRNSEELLKINRTWSDLQVYLMKNQDPRGAVPAFSMDEINLGPFSDTPLKVSSAASTAPNVVTPAEFTKASNLYQSLIEEKSFLAFRGNSDFKKRVHHLLRTILSTEVGRDLLYQMDFSIEPKQLVLVDRVAGQNCLTTETPSYLHNLIPEPETISTSQCVTRKFSFAPSKQLDIEFYDFYLPLISGKRGDDKVFFNPNGGLMQFWSSLLQYSAKQFGLGSLATIHNPNRQQPHLFQNPILKSWPFLRNTEEKEAVFKLINSLFVQLFFNGEDSSYHVSNLMHDLFITPAMKEQFRQQASLEEVFSKGLVSEKIMNETQSLLSHFTRILQIRVNESQPVLKVIQATLNTFKEAQISSSSIQPNFVANLTANSPKNPLAPDIKDIILGAFLNERYDIFNLVLKNIDVSSPEFKTYFENKIDYFSNPFNFLNVTKMHQFMMGHDKLKKILIDYMRRGYPGRIGINGVLLEPTIRGLLNSAHESMCVLSITSVVSMVLLWKSEHNKYMQRNFAAIYSLLANFVAIKSLNYLQNQLD